MDVKKIWEEEASKIEQEWNEDPRWKGIKRNYTPLDVVRLRGSIRVEYTLAKLASQKLWKLLQTEPYVATFGALTGSQAVEMAKAGLKAIYVSGWQVAADNNLSGQTYPDLSLYPSNSVPTLVKRLNNALIRADQIAWSEGKYEVDYLLPIVADAEAGFGGPIHAYELMKAMIEAGAAGVHFEDQLASEKKCGHLGGKVLIPTSNFIRILNAARLASDVLGVPTILIARTDALNAVYLSNDSDERDSEFLTGRRTAEGYYEVKGGIDFAIARGLAYAPYADLLWFETSKPDLDEARQFAEAIHTHYPGKLLAYNLSPSFNWKKFMDDSKIGKFIEELADLGYKFQFITLAGWHLINYYTFNLAKAFKNEGMLGYVKLQELEFQAQRDGYTAVAHQREVGTEYFDLVLTIASGGQASTVAMKGSTEAEQFIPVKEKIRK
ncbi:isocitrate lyase [Sulfolobus sp. A20]|uniref:isocitrate lyase n=2 Tax=Sulfolobaceae TaxID=118883 RepID=UPI000845BFA5|nr:isocitrate lyase [Sulfolobus sp. A20]TRM76197.1 isocitrate lyase [Sulfolobus sp. A20-N-F8]TRM79086.1 isocitrate lyase [Sulfolobus sp. B5]TRM80650.1 isocitrate lyase [Sulfolobus sp. D5]TRM86532.1 isocitrate lyase [Sulfolobus sp. E3]TRM87720.1 isocitrate lyase [Sulfolobus sp. C3]TRN01789.1 isocitrate lyase [Sulfolobus sp. F1]TRN01875.1 isocitrate lyase [Sulfolobus sp. E1]